MSASIFQLIVLPRLAQLSGRFSRPAWVYTSTSITACRAISVYSPCQCRHREVAATTKGSRGISHGRPNNKAAMAYAYAEDIAEGLDRDGPPHLSSGVWGRGDGTGDRGVLGDGHDPPIPPTSPFDVTLDREGQQRMGDRRRRGEKASSTTSGRDQAAEPSTRAGASEKAAGAAENDTMDSRYKSPRRERRVAPQPVFPDRPEDTPDLSCPAASGVGRLDAAFVIHEPRLGELSPLRMATGMDMGEAPDPPAASSSALSTETRVTTTPPRLIVSPAPTAPPIRPTQRQVQLSPPPLPAPPMDPLDALSHIPGGLKRVRQLSVLSDALDTIERAFSPSTPSASSPTAAHDRVRARRRNDSSHAASTLSTRIRIPPHASRTLIPSGGQYDRIPPALARLLDAGFFRLVTLHVLRTPIYARDERLVKSVLRRLDKAGAWGLAQRLRDETGMGAREGQAMMEIEGQGQARVQAQARAQRHLWTGHRHRGESDSETGQTGAGGERDLTALYNSHLARALTGSRIITAPMQGVHEDEFGADGRAATMGERPDGFVAADTAHETVQARDTDGQLVCASPSHAKSSSPSIDSTRNTAPSPETQPHLESSTPSSIPPPPTTLSYAIYPNHPLPPASATYAQLRALIRRIASLEAHRGFRPDAVTANMVVKSWVACRRVKRLVRETYVAHCHGPTLVRERGVGKVDGGVIMQEARIEGGHEEKVKKGSKSARRRAAVRMYGKEAVAARARELRAARAERVARAEGAQRTAESGRAEQKEDQRGRDNDEAMIAVRHTAEERQATASAIQSTVSLDLTSSSAPAELFARPPPMPSAESPRRSQPQPSPSSSANLITESPFTSPAKVSSAPTVIAYTASQAVQIERSRVRDGSTASAEALDGVAEEVVDPVYETELGALFRFVSGLYDTELSRIEGDVRRLIEPWSDTIGSAAAAASPPSTPATSSDTSSPSPSNPTPPPASPLHTIPTAQSHTTAPNAPPPPQPQPQPPNTPATATPTPTPTSSDTHTTLKLQQHARAAARLYRHVRAFTNTLGKSVWRDGEYGLGERIRGWREGVRGRVEGLEEEVRGWGREGVRERGGWGGR